MTGSYRSSVADIARRAVGLSDNWNVAGTGNFPTIRAPYLNIEDDEAMLDRLMGRLMVHTQKVVVPCKWCGSHNAFSNPTCVKCGGPLG